MLVYHFITSVNNKSLRSRSADGSWSSNVIDAVFLSVTPENEICGVPFSPLTDLLPRSESSAAQQEQRTVGRGKQAFPQFSESVVALKETQ